MLYFIAFLEGFSTLAVEIIALRLATPIVGSSIILTSIFLGIILLALSAGYYVGGHIASTSSNKKIYILLISYFLISGLFYGLVSFNYEQELLGFLLQYTDSYLISLFAVVIILFFFPVFIASQSIPLLTELTPEQSKGKAAGSFLFASTVGSFLGSVLTSIVFFEEFGVQRSAVFVSCLLIFCAYLTLFLYHKKSSFLLLIALIIYSISLFFITDNNALTIPGVLFHKDSAYQEIIIREGKWQDGKDTRFFHLNRSFSSAMYIENKESPFTYLQEAIKITQQGKPKNILVIGTAGFSYPQQVAKYNFVEHIDAVDIDPILGEVAEKYFLQEKLDAKINFIPYSARYALYTAKKEKKMYDLILLDAYNGKSLPDELTTKEFFNDLKQLAPQGQILANFILDTDLTSNLAVNLLTTFQHTFGISYIKNVSNNKEGQFDNFLVSQKQLPDYNLRSNTVGEIYTDNLRTTEHDLVTMRNKAH